MGHGSLAGRGIILAAVAALALGGCTSAAGPIWTFGPNASPAAAPTLTAGASAPSSSSPAPSTTSTPAPSSSPAGGAVSYPPTPSPTATGTAGPSTSPAPPDPGEPGFVAGTRLKPRVIKVNTSDLLLFSPTVLNVAQGETITFTITNPGQATHEFKVGPMADVFADNPATPEVADITPGSTRTLTYTFDGTGPYAFACHAPGHFENGMYGFVHVAPTVPWLGTADHPRMVVVGMDDHLEFVPSEVSVTPGETILFVLPNVGYSVTHEFQVGPADRVALDQADGQIVVEADAIQPQHVAYLTYTFGSASPYAFACHQPGHYAAGMKGVVDLTP
jgi:uncharacterized cupredoxin-like copper-binding protein